MSFNVYTKNELVFIIIDLLSLVFHLTLGVHFNVYKPLTDLKNNKNQNDTMMLLGKTLLLISSFVE